MKDKLYTIFRDIKFAFIHCDDNEGWTKKGIRKVSANLSVHMKLFTGIVINDHHRHPSMPGYAYPCCGRNDGIQMAPILQGLGSYILADRKEILVEVHCLTSDRNLLGINCLMSDRNLFLEVHCLTSGIWGGFVLLKSSMHDFLISELRECSHDVIE
ncbi:hypothetical protein CEXT_177331 [Caerostris extrusa]|uniref:Uncharacterized protein n=1 Tax=Caerostris extrusa TaxID=172846 RepID=A0AAV4R4M7_CAEEX|nr:hypothetical protein CEXT_177331 [Caerostris extrusa]